MADAFSKPGSSSSPKAASKGALDLASGSTHDTKIVEQSICKSQPRAPGEDVTYHTDIPTADLEGALSSLKPMKMLSTTVLELVLRKSIINENVRIFDCAFTTVMTPAQMWEQHKQKAVRAKDHQNLYVIPLLHGDHYTLIIAHLDTRLIVHYDSLQQTACEQRARGVIEPIKKALLESDPARFDRTDWMFQVGEVPQQRNGYDCGVYVLVTYMYYVIQRPLPAQINCKLWRSIFTKLLSTPSMTQNVRTIDHTEINPVPGGDYQGACICLTINEVAYILLTEYCRVSFLLRRLPNPRNPSSLRFPNSMRLFIRYKKTSEPAILPARVWRPVYLQ